MNTSYLNINCKKSLRFSTRRASIGSFGKWILGVIMSRKHVMLIVFSGVFLGLALLLSSSLSLAQLVEQSSPSSGWDEGRQVTSNLTQSQSSLAAVPTTPGTTYKTFSGGAFSPTNSSLTYSAQGGAVYATALPPGGFSFSLELDLPQGQKSPKWSSSWLTTIPLPTWISVCVRTIQRPIHFQPLKPRLPAAPAHLSKPLWFRWIRRFRWTIPPLHTACGLLRGWRLRRIFCAGHALAISSRRCTCRRY